MTRFQVIYFLRREDGLVKIGYSTRLGGRIHELQKSHGKLELLKYVNGDKRREDQIHHLCRRHHEYGEWFRDSPELRLIIEGIEQGEAVPSEASQAKKAWADYEAAIAEKVCDRAKQLVMLEYAANGNVILAAIKAQAERYGIPYSTLEHVFYRRGRVVSAAVAAKIEEALLEAKKARLAGLIADLEAEKNFPNFEDELSISDEIKSIRRRFDEVVQQTAQ